MTSLSQVSFRRLLQSKKNLPRCAFQTFIWKAKLHILPATIRLRGSQLPTALSTTLQILVEWRRIKGDNDHTAGHCGRKEAAAAASLSRRSPEAEKLPGDLSGTKQWQHLPKRETCPWDNLCTKFALEIRTHPGSKLELFFLTAQRKFLRPNWRFYRLQWRTKTTKVCFGLFSLIRACVKERVSTEYK